MLNFMKYPLHLSKLIEHLKKLPGVGFKTAERFAFQLLSWNENSLIELSNLIAGLNSSLDECKSCGALCDSQGCLICHDLSRDKKTICVVVSKREIFAFEETGQFRGLYHVLGSLFSPMQGKVLDAQRLDALKKRIFNNQVTEVIVAIDATLEGDATALFIKESLQDVDVKVSRIAFGLPQNCSLEFVDGSTLSYALRGRSIY